MRIALRYGIAVVASVSIGTLGLALPAAAAPVKSLTVSGSSSLSIVYGQNWYVPFDSTAYCGDGTVTIAESGTTLGTTKYYENQGSVYLASGDISPLSAGTHTLTVTRTAAYCGTDSGSVTVSVAKAALTVDARVTADPNAPGNAIITMLGVGDFVDNLVPTWYLQGNTMAPRFPAGTWAMSIADADGHVVHKTSVATKFGDEP
jgi:hypothetical protein